MPSSRSAPAHRHEAANMFGSRAHVGGDGLTGRHHQWAPIQPASMACRVRRRQVTDLADETNPRCAQCEPETQREAGVANRRNIGRWIVCTWDSRGLYTRPPIRRWTSWSQDREGGWRPRIDDVSPASPPMPTILSSSRTNGSGRTISPARRQVGPLLEGSTFRPTAP